MKSSNYDADRRAYLIPVSSDMVKEVGGDWSEWVQFRFVREGGAGGVMGMEFRTVPPRDLVAELSGLSSEELA